MSQLVQRFRKKSKQLISCSKNYFLIHLCFVAYKILITQIIVYQKTKQTNIFNIFVTANINKMHFLLIPCKAM